MRTESSCMKDVLPFAAMMLLECGDVGMITLGKAAMNAGMSNFVYVVYYNALGTLFLLPYFIFHTYRRNMPPLTFSLLWKLFGLGLIGICLLQVSAYTGISYSSPTLAAAMGNLIPAFTFLLAVFFRMEKLDLKTSSSLTKLLGTTVAISGAFAMTLYEGPSISFVKSSSESPHQLLLSQHSNWALGGFFLAITCICSSTWNIFQTATVKEYADEITIVFFYCCFGSIQCAIFSLIVERNPGAWILHPGIETIAIVYSGIFGGVLHNIIITWCLNKKGPVYVAMFKPMAMVIAVIMGVVFLGDTLHVGSVVGAILIAAGFYAVIWGQALEKKAFLDIVCGLESPNENSPILKK